jgi:hypothetical protein
MGEKYDSKLDRKKHTREGIHYLQGKHSSPTRLSCLALSVAIFLAGFSFSLCDTEARLAKHFPFAGK